MCFCYSAIVNCVLNHLLCMQKDISNISKQGWGASWQKPWRMVISLYQCQSRWIKASQFPLSKPILFLYRKELLQGDSKKLIQIHNCKETYSHLTFQQLIARLMGWKRAPPCLTFYTRSRNEIFYFLFFCTNVSKAISPTLPLHLPIFCKHKNL